MRLTKNFTLKELCRSQTAIRKNIKNTPDSETTRQLQLLCTHVLQKIRDKIGAIRITSGYRSPALNRAIGGAKKPISQHTKGQAVDCIIVIDGKIQNKKILDAVIDLDIDFDQMIWEFGGEWVHISYNENGNRRQILEAYKDENNKTNYKTYPPKYNTI
jgi:zinc D-Ala-D-Ala carboxypeptidase